MILLDSSVWIEHLTGGPRLRNAEAIFRDPGEILVSAVNLYEVGRYVLRTTGDEAMEEVVAHMSRCQIRPVDPEIILSALALADEHRLHLADALIAATARVCGTELLTYDADLLKLPEVREP